MHKKYIVGVTDQERAELGAVIKKFKVSWSESSRWTGEVEPAWKLLAAEPAHREPCKR
jgi:hypothetical protein